MNNKKRQPLTADFVESTTPYLTRLLDQLNLVMNSVDLGILVFDSNQKFIWIGNSLSVNKFQRAMGQNNLETILKEHSQLGTKILISNVLVNYPGLQVQNPCCTSSNTNNDFPNSSWLFVPILCDEIIVGYLWFIGKSGEAFLHRDVQTAISFSEIVSDYIMREESYLETITKADETKSFLRIQQALTSQLELDSVLQLIVDDARRLTNTRTTIILLINGENLRTAAISGPFSSDVFIGYEIPISNSNTGKSILEGRPIHVSDAENNPTVYRSDHLQVKSFVSVPLMTAGKPIGAIMFTDKLTGAFNKNDERLASMFASSAVIALENARLYHEEQMRRQEAEQRKRIAEGVQEILRILNSQYPLQEMLQQINQEICELLQSDACAIYQLVDDGSAMSLQSSYGLDKNNLQTEDYPINKNDLIKISLLRQPGVLDLNEKTYSTEDGELLIDLSSEVKIDIGFLCSIAVPLFDKTSQYGELILFFKDPHIITSRKLKLATIVGDQLMLAIENANLKTITEELARLQERQRIAQALHDSVAQMLFSLGIEVEELLKSHQVDSKCEKSLQTIRQLSSRSSHELRTAIFTLQEEKQKYNKSNLVSLIEESVRTFRTETGIPITFITPDYLPNLRPEVTEAIYRIARESLSNIHKHSQASAVIINLKLDTESIHILIQDDGIGLDAHASKEAIPEYLHFGIATMHQLASQAHGEFRILNGDEQGVIVKASFPLLEENMK